MEEIQSPGFINFFLSSRRLVLMYFFILFFFYVTYLKIHIHLKKEIQNIDEHSVGWRRKEEKNLLKQQSSKNMPVCVNNSMMSSPTL